MYPPGRRDRKAEMTTTPYPQDVLIRMEGPYLSPGQGGSELLQRRRPPPPGIPIVVAFPLFGGVP